MVDTKDMSVLLFLLAAFLWLSCKDKVSMCYKRRRTNGFSGFDEGKIESLCQLTGGIGPCLMRLVSWSSGLPLEAVQLFLPENAKIILITLTLKCTTCSIIYIRACLTFEWLRCLLFSVDVTVQYGSSHCAMLHSHFCDSWDFPAVGSLGLMCHAAWPLSLSQEAETGSWRGNLETRLQQQKSYRESSAWTRSLRAMNWLHLCFKSDHQLDSHLQHIFILQHK